MDLYKKMILTFDDGYKDNYELMFPILKKYRFKVVIYLVTRTDHNVYGVLEKEPRVNLMTSSQVKEMSDYGLEIGGHTQQHLDLSKCPEEELVREVKGSKDDVEREKNIRCIPILPIVSIKVWKAIWN